MQRSNSPSDERREGANDWDEAGEHNRLSSVLSIEFLHRRARKGSEHCC